MPSKARRRNLVRKKWREDNAVTVTAYYKKYKEQNIGKVRANQKRRNMQNARKLKVNLEDWRNKNPVAVRKSKQKWNRENSDYKKKWRQSFANKASKWCRKWQKKNREKFLTSCKHSQLKNMLKYARRKVKWYRLNAVKQCNKRRILYKKNLLKEQHLRRQRYRVNLIIESRYFRRSKAFLKSGELVAAQKFEREIFSHLCALEKCKESDPKAIGIRVSAKSLVVRALNQRNTHVFNLKRSLTKFKNNCSTMLTRVKEKNYFTINDLCGAGLHTKSSEPFFKKFSYSENYCNFGNFDDFLSKKSNSGDNIDFKNAEWSCNPTICVLPENAEIRLKNLLNKLEETSNFRKFLAHGDIDACIHKNNNAEKQGHPVQCLPHTCSSDFLFLRQLAVHFPKIRTLVRHLYNVRHYDAQLIKLDSALVKCNIKFLKSIAENNELTVTAVANTSLPAEQTIMKLPYFKVYEKEIRQIPKHDCISCCIYHYRREVRKVTFDYDSGGDIKIFIGNRNRRGSEKACNNLWLELYASVQIREFDQNQLSSLFVCKNCLDSLVNGKRHYRLSIFNNLEVAPLSPKLKVLNDYEALLLQRAKCFQVILRLGSVGSKLPYSDRVKALKGQVVHYPLPMNETLNSLPSDNSMPADCGLDFILLGVPTKNRHIWQSIVNTDKVKAAFLELRKINPEYSKINVDWAPLSMLNVSDDSAPNSEKVDACKLISSESMLKKVDAQERGIIFESYTVHPLHPNRPLQSDLDMYQLKRVTTERIDNRELKMDLWCFPLLFPNGQCGMNAVRYAPLSNRDWIKSKLLNKDSRFRRNHQYIFYLLHQYHLRAVASGVLQSLRNSYSYNSMSVKDFVQMVQNGHQQLEANLYTMFRQMRGSSEYFSARRLDLKTMIRELGPPTWFVTLSAAEYDWEDMSSMLIELNKDVTDVEKMRTSTRCVMDPVFTSRHFHHRFASFFRNVLYCKSGGPLGKVVDFFWRVEYQSRGAPHYHMLLWCENSPRIGIDPPEKVIEFIQQHVTCRLPNKSTEPLLHQSVTRYQMHRVCNSYCQRKRCVNGKYFTHCRFGFPRKPLDNAVLHNPLATCRERSKGKNDRLYELARSESEVRINDYNPVIALLWRANHDVQFVGETTNAVVNYISSYITKGEKSNLLEMFDEIDKDANLGKRLYKFAIRKLSMRECGALEACDTLLGQHLYEKSRQIVYICARKPHLRSRQLKPLKKIKECMQADPNSLDKYENDWITNYYPDRPDSLENLCMYDFRKWYTKCNSGNESLKFRTLPFFVCKRKEPFLISHPVYRYTEQVEEFCYSLLLMFKPFRNECSELLDESGKCKSVFEQELLCNKKLAEYHEKLTAHTKLIEDNNKAIHGEVVLHKDNKAHSEPDEIGQPLEAANAMFEFNVAMRLAVGGESLNDNISKMNADQMRIFDFITNHLQHSKDQLFLFISGAGGTGKSFLINTLKLWVREYYKINSTVIAVTAPTGLAAYNVSGITLHRLLQLPVQHGSTERFNHLNDSACKEMSLMLKHLKILVIDEVSMVSNLMLAYTHLRLNQIFNTQSALFGGLNVIVMGDLAQLTPVCASPIFLSLTAAEVTNKIGGLCGVDLWKSFLCGYEELNISMRQKNDPVYANLLNRLRFGYLTADDVLCLQSRLIPIDDSIIPINALAKYYLDLRKQGNEAVCLMSKSSMVSTFNQHLLSIEEGEILEFAAIDTFDFASEAHTRNINHAKQLLKKREDKASETAGIEALLKLGIGCRIMLRRNIKVDSGLVNGAVGTVIGFFKHSIDSLVESILVKFDNIGDAQAIERITVKFALNKNVMVVRKQFPLVLSYAMTIHKSQGLSLDHVMADVGNTIFQSGMTYVALSRVKTLAGLHLLNFDPSKAVANDLCIHEINRLRETFHPTMQQIVINKEKLPWVGDRIWCDSMIQKVAWTSEDHPATTKQNGKKRKCEAFTDKNKKAKTFSRPFLATKIQWPKFDNSLSKQKVSCYSNASFQILFLMSDFQVACSGMQADADPVKKEIFSLYMLYQERKCNGHRRLFTSKVRQSLGYPFRNSDGQQCAFDFIRALTDRLDLSNMFEVTLLYRYRCKCNTNKIFKTEQEELGSMLFSLNNGVDFQHFLRGWQLVGDGWACQECMTNDKVECETTVINTSNYIILRINRFTGVPGDQVNNDAVKNFNCDCVHIGSDVFRVLGAILYFGDTTSGHYIAIIRSDTYGWLKCNDHEISKINMFPNHLKDVSLLLFEKSTS